MANEKSGRILDKDFESGIAGGMNDFKNDVRDEAQADINKVQKYARARNVEIETMISEHPKSFVLGAFIGGLALGALIAKGNK